MNELFAAIKLYVSACETRPLTYVIEPSTVGGAGGRGYGPSVYVGDRDEHPSGHGVGPSIRIPFPSPETEVKAAEIRLREAKQRLKEFNLIPICQKARDRLIEISKREK